MQSMPFQYFAAQDEGDEQIEEMIELEDAWSPDLELRDREATAVAGG